MHGDADNDLSQYPDGAFDYVVLSRTLQAVEKPREVLRQMLRIGTRALVSSNSAMKKAPVGAASPKFFEYASLAGMQPISASSARHASDE